MYNRLGPGMKFCSMCNLQQRTCIYGYITRNTIYRICVFTSLCFLSPHFFLQICSKDCAQWVIDAGHSGAEGRLHSSAHHKHREDGDWLSSAAGAEACPVPGVASLHLDFRIWHKTKVPGIHYCCLSFIIIALPSGSSGKNTLWTILSSASEC